MIYLKMQECRCLEMNSFLVLCADGVERNVTTYSVQEFPYAMLHDNTIPGKRGVCYINIVTTFDIETTTITIGEKKEGFMYHWQMSIDGVVVFGRTWQEWMNLINGMIAYFNLSENRRIVVWVHNLSYEFQFIRRFLEWSNVFAKKRREVLKALTTTGIEFRCSYYLTNMSLAKACENAKNCTFRKLDGDTYDYRKIRYPDTPMSNYELGYCYCDVAGLAEVISEYLESDTLNTIPLTSTGFIRRECRNAMRKNPKNREIFNKMALSVEQYKLLQEAKRGGNTACNRAMSQIIVSNVHCIDESSAYSYTMLCEYFPMSAFSRIGNLTIHTFRRYLDEYCCLFRVTFSGLKLRSNVPVPYIPCAKLTMHGKEDIIFNGRVMQSDACQMAVTELDFEIIEKQYTWDAIGISDFHFARRGYLPDELREQIREYYRQKTALKGVDDYLYAKSKNRINGVFGMACTDPVHDVIYIDDEGLWHEDKGDIYKELEKFYRSRNSFLPIQWGVWVTAHARCNLQRAIDMAGMDTVYTDTDSVKYIENAIDIEKLNEIPLKKAKENKAYAVDKKGNIHYMGVFEVEKTNDRFVTYGAKKYAYEIDGKVHITVAGVGKKKGAEFLEKSGGLESFRSGFIWTEGNGGGTESYWNDDEIHTLHINGHTILTAANVGVLESTYTLGVTEEFLQNKNFLLDNF